MRGELRDGSGALVAIVEVDETATDCRGTVLGLGPAEDPASLWMRRLFTAFERTVNAQLFVEVDRLDAEIARLEVTFAAAGIPPTRVVDLQVHPSEMALSFRLQR